MSTKISSSKALCVNRVSAAKILLWLAFTPAVLAKDVTFNADVRPILSENCFFCHGPDKAKQKADLRLDTPEGAAEAIESGEVWKRISSSNADEVMPPPDSKLTLTSDEKAILKQWIESGAKYEAHWAYIPLPQTIPVPPKANTQPLDAFVLAQLDELKMQPSPPTEPLRWLRRVTLDLTGLPPTMEQIAAFGKRTGDKYADTVDELLASRSFGENFAVMWLDGARYGDSSGYHNDGFFTNWPYRDWVVRALNADMPYDQFITWNLAGDLLPSATRDQILATAFNRLHRVTNEGGSVWEEFFVDGVADRVQTMGTVMLGLTLECARCHDHKYDPITQRDYYSLFAFFNSIPETGVFNHESIAPPPTLLLPTKEQEELQRKLRQSIADLEAKLAAAQTQAEPRFAVWITASERNLTLTDETGRFSFEENSSPFKNQASKTTDAKLASPVFVPGKRGTALKLDGDRGLVFPDYMLVDRWDAFTITLWLRDTLRDPKPVVVAHRTYGHDVGRNGTELVLEDGHLHARVFRSWPANGIGIRSVDEVPQSEWAHVSFRYDGSSRVEGLRLFLNGKELATEATGNHLHKKVGIKTVRGGDFIIGANFRGRGFKGGEVDELRIFERALTSHEIRDVAGISPLTEMRDETSLREYYLSAHDPNCRKLIADLKAARQALAEHEEKYTEICVMQDMLQPRPAHLLARGAYDAPRSDKDLVTRDTLRALIPFPKDAPRNRLGLAQWLTQPDHPLTARVMVNRVWQRFFGRGLVGSMENFGVQGEQPTHPALLDWLARDFISHGWSVKHLCRQIALSSTYRQASGGSRLLIESDPDNRLLARGPSHRLSAEMIRDLALVASGLLTNKKDGPPVRPYDPLNNSKPALSDVHCRTLFSNTRRTKPLPNMIALDRPSMEFCVVKRSRTYSPAQALVLLNDVQFVEAARVLAMDVMSSEPTLNGRLQLAWQRVTGLQPSVAEMEVLQAMHAEQLAHFKTDDEAMKLLRIGLKPLPEKVEAISAAAFTVVCQAILNSDAAVWKR